MILSDKYKIVGTLLKTGDRKQNSKNENNLYCTAILSSMEKKKVVDFLRKMCLILYSF